MPITFRVPIETKSTSNLREHHMARARRVKKQREATTLAMGVWVGEPLLVVTLTRVAPRALDDDNLRGALKAVRDAVAARLRIDDASPLVRWEYTQEKTPRKYAPYVRVHVARHSAPLVTHGG